jgi:capsular polysaccharide export protein
MDGLPWLPADTDPWDLCSKAALILADADNETALVAVLTGARLRVIGEGRFAATADPENVEAALESELGGWEYRDPFNGDVVSAAYAIELLGRWRQLIDANRPVAAVYGIAQWKRIATDVLLWGGTGSARHASGKGDQVLAWVARSDATRIAELQESGVCVGEIEDGMIRSTGLGANCVPPLSIVVDMAGPHFDPAQASTLETILQTATIEGDLLLRAAALREHLVSAGISKYEQDSLRPDPVKRPDARRRVLVTGQVEDDRSVLCGGAGLNNLELLRRARAAEPDARIIFKPHPDVEAGHRKGRVPDPQALQYADEIDRSSSIAALLDGVDGVHVLTSLAGFEALMRGRDVTTHGVPFYAGWGLTRDLGPVPARRSRKRNLDELVAATLILYPRYLDPVTRLPCEPELLVDRIASGNATLRSPLVRLREFQGRLKRMGEWLNPGKVS